MIYKYFIAVLYFNGGCDTLIRSGCLARHHAFCGSIYFWAWGSYSGNASGEGWGAGVAEHAASGWSNGPLASIALVPLTTTCLFPGYTERPKLVLSHYGSLTTGTQSSEKNLFGKVAGTGCGEPWHGLIASSQWQKFPPCHALHLLYLLILVLVTLLWLHFPEAAWLL